MNDLETHVLQIIAEDTDDPDVFTDDATGLVLIRGSINDAIQELCMVTGSYTRIYHLALQEDKQFYRIQARKDFFCYATEVWDRNRKRKLIQSSVQSIAKEDPLWMKRTGSNPEYYGHVGNSHLWIYPYMSASGIVLEIRFCAVPHPYTEDTDIIRLRENFQNAAVFLSVSEYFASRGDAKRATDYLTRYLEAAGMMQLHPQQPERQWQVGGFEGNRYTTVVKQ